MCVYAMVTSFIYSPSLAENAIGNKGAKALSRALLVNRTLTSLKWDSLQITINVTLCAYLKVPLTQICVKYLPSQIGSETWYGISIMILYII